MATSDTPAKTYKHTPLDTKAAEVERERLKSLVNSMADGVIAIDESLKIVLYNGAALNIMDINETMAGNSIQTVLSIVDKNSAPIDLVKQIKDIKTQYTNRDWLIKYQDNSVANIYLSIAPVRLGYGQEGMHGYVILLRDITREKSLEEERDEFISVVSHELRTPIAIAEGNISNAEFIFDKSGVENPSITDTLRQAHEQINFLSSMINDLSTLSRAERGTLELEVESINVHQLLEDLGKNYTPEATNKQLHLHVEIDPKLELLNSSKLYVREILQNFITNAIKYTEEGSVTIAGKPAKQGVSFYVSDTGIGLSKTDQEKVFDKFYRSEDYRTRKNSGTGLGLYVTMKLARMLHAEIHVTSELNKGSTFTIYIPNIQETQKKSSAVQVD